MEFANFLSENIDDIAFLITLIVVIYLALIVHFMVYGYEDFMDKVGSLYERGNICGKIIILITAVIVLILIAPVLLIYFIVLGFEKLCLIFWELCFPPPFRKEISIPPKKILEKLREEKIRFIIGEEYIVFDCVEDWKKAQKFIGKKNGKKQEIS